MYNRIYSFRYKYEYKLSVKSNVIHACYVASDEPRGGGILRLPNSNETKSSGKTNETCYLTFIEWRILNRRSNKMFFRKSTEGSGRKQQ